MRKFSITLTFSCLLLIVTTITKQVFADGTLSVSGNTVGQTITLIGQPDATNCNQTAFTFTIHHVKMQEWDVQKGLFPLDFSNANIQVMVNGKPLEGFIYYKDYNFITWFPQSTASPELPYPQITRRSTVTVTVTGVKVTSSGQADISTQVAQQPDWNTCYSFGDPLFSIDQFTGIVNQQFDSRYILTFVEPQPTSTTTPTSIPTLTPTTTQTIQIFTPSPTLQFPIFHWQLPQLPRLSLPTIVQTLPTPTPTSILDSLRSHHPNLPR